MSASTSEDHTSAVAKHYNQLQETGLEKRTQSRIFHLRNFNNWTKSVLIGEFLDKIRDTRGRNADINVLDLCSGKGGDLLKWKKGNIRHLVCADIASTSVEQSESRYKEMLDRNDRERHPSSMFRAEFYSVDCTKVRLRDLYRDPGLTFDLVSCQFSFHYSFESLPQAEVMLQNAAECLKEGGYFIGTTPNSNELVKRLKSSEDNSFGNDVYRVTFDDKDAFDLFGCRYDFHLAECVDCPEFLVHFPILEKMGEAYGLKLVYKKSFADFFEEKHDIPQHRGLLGRMQSLEPYPADEGSTLVGGDIKNYPNAESEYKKQQENSDKKHLRIGTLSKDEWEATTIYLAFAFQKISTGERERTDRATDLATDRVTADAQSERKRTHADDTSDNSQPDEKVSKS